ncbi:MOSC domain-containing protein [Demequina aurantiaca]|uniref:MOSC domain-containing protein n=1 Tax=Demequina aurantiaca TaxID=676200 RepID=UPI000780E4C2|nr:MOSC N-terminal beta barrel domain-containing protein [Demequina aurantiaca]
MDKTVASLRRYPVKSMGGESLDSVDVEARGFAGDRAFAVSDGDGRFASGKNTRRMVRRDGVFGFTARTADAAVLVSDGEAEWAVGDPALDARLTDALAAEVRVSAEQGVSHFDEGPVSVVGTATLEWCARELGVDADPRRLRVNMVVETSEPFEEELWSGDVGVGGAVLRPVGRLGRCRTIDLVQDGVEQTTRWLKALGDTRDACVAIYCDVVTPGAVRIGDPVHFPVTSVP